MNTEHLYAPNRWHLPTLIEVRKLLEQDTKVEVHFDNDAPSVAYEPEDLPALRQKILYSM